MLSAPEQTGKQFPRADAAAILAALRLILEPGQVTELRALDAVTAADRRPHVEAGYFDDPEKLASAAAGITHAKGIYFIPNPVSPALLARAVNKTRAAPRGENTQDGDVTRRRWLLVDTDPVRPSGIASTDAEHQAALDRAAAVAEALTAAGWPPPVVADSGNGGHLMYAIDLPADDGGLVQHCLQALAARFDDGAVKIDQTVFNPARIWKLYGTLAGKGDPAAAALGRPHRLARILSAPDPSAVVARDLLEALAAGAPQPQAPEGARRRRAAAPPNGTASPADAPAGSFDVGAWLREHNLDATGPEEWRSQDGQAGRRWVFPVCPWNPEHTDRSAFIVQFASGAVAAGCQHNGCAGRDWHALRDLVEPGRLDRPNGGAAALAWLKKHGVDVVGVRKLGKARGAFDLVLADERAIEVGTAADLLSPRKVQAALADGAGVVIPLLTLARWRPIAQALLGLAEQVDCFCEPQDELAGWINRWIKQCRERVKWYREKCRLHGQPDKVTMEWIVDEVRKGYAVRADDGTTYLRLEELLARISTLGIRMSLPDLARRMRRAGWLPRQLSARVGEDVLKARAWISPPGWQTDDCEAVPGVAGVPTE
jgi:hypothetical protein